MYYMHNIPSSTLLVAVYPGEDQSMVGGRISTLYRLLL